MAGIAKGQRVTGEDRAALTSQVTQRYTEGASIRELAAETGRSYGFIHRLLKDGGVGLRGRGGATRRRTAAA